MFSVGLLYDTRDFLRLIPDVGITPTEFKTHFKEYKYSKPDRILEIAFKCGWSRLTHEGQIELSEKGVEISKYEYQPALLLQLEDMIANFNPVWGSVLLKGRSEAKNFLPPDVLQCFKECGLFGKLTDEIIKYWDKLALAYRHYSQKKMTEIGRAGEKLSYDYEKKRTGMDPVWQALESNLSGFDLLSFVDKSKKQKLMIEVKTTTSHINYARIHISQNEWETACSSLEYIFHLWHINDTAKLYKVSVDQMRKHIPANHGNGNWESVEIPFKIFSYRAT